MEVCRIHFRLRVWGCDRQGPGFRPCRVAGVYVCGLRLRDSQIRIWGVGCRIHFRIFWRFFWSPVWRFMGDEFGASEMSL